MAVSGMPPTPSLFQQWAKVELVPTPRVIAANKWGLVAVKNLMLLFVFACLAACGANDTDEDNPASGSVALQPDAPLEIAINQFPGGYQGRWGASAANCADENDEQMMSLQGKLVRFQESIGTMTAGKRTTSRTMEADFEFLADGEKWNKSIAFELSTDGKSLTRKDKEDGISYEYVQCPKLMAG